MRILIISSGHALDDDRIVYKQGFSLTKLGYDVTYCAQYRFPIKHDRMKFLEVNEPYGSTGSNDVSRDIKFVPQSRFKKLFRLYRHVKSLAPDLVVVHDYETAILAWWIKKRLKIPYVFDVHECFQYTASEKFGKLCEPLLRPIVVHSLKCAAQNAEAVTVVSPANKAFFEDLAPNVPVEILHNSPILDYFPYSEEGADKMTIVHEGNFMLNRGALQIAEALPIVRERHDFRMLILGTVSADVKDRFYELLSHSTIPIDIEMPGRLPWTEFGKVESQGHIGLICMQPTPNNFGSLSNKLYTYMACGLAVLGMKGSQTAMMIDKYKCGIAVDPTSPKEIAEGIMYLIEHPEERIEMVRNGRRAIEEELGWHKMELVMEQLYKKIEENIMS